MEAEKDANSSTRLYSIANYKPFTANTVNSVSGASNNKNFNIDCEVLLIGDSNLASLKPEIMNKGTKCQKIICYTLEDVTNMIKSANIINSPKKSTFK